MMPKTFYFTSRAKFDALNDSGGLAWSTYVEWSRLFHLKELVSLDGSLNEVLVEVDQKSEDDWKNIVVADYYETGFFRTLDFVLHRTKAEQFNLLTVVIEPEGDCASIRIDDYDFLGYELLDQYYDTSALSNCGGFDKTFLPSDLNNVGLIGDYENANRIKTNLLENNPLEEHANTNIIAIWRHRWIGQ
jgi:hypothetical protein